MTADNSIPDRTANAGDLSHKPDRQKALASTLRESRSPAITRAAAILRLLGKSDAPISLQVIARELGLVPSTCLYTLRALAAEQLVAFDPDTKRYALEAGLLTLAQHWLRRNQFAGLVQPDLDRLGQAFGITALGVQIVGLEHIIVVATSQSSGNFQISAQIGSRFPGLISATGRCVAAFGGHPPELLKEGFDALRWDEAPTFSEWQGQVEETQRRGIAVDTGNYISGVTVVAAPVWKGRSQLSHAVVAIGVGSVLRNNTLPDLQIELLATARALSTQLCGEVSPD